MNIFRYINDIGPDTFISIIIIELLLILGTTCHPEYKILRIRSLKNRENLEKLFAENSENIFVLEPVQRTENRENSQSLKSTNKNNPLQVWNFIEQNNFNDLTLALKERDDLPDLCKNPNLTPARRKRCTDIENRNKVLSQLGLDKENILLKTGKFTNSINCNSCKINQNFDSHHNSDKDNTHFDTTPKKHTLLGLNVTDNSRADTSEEGLVFQTKTLEEIDKENHLLNTTYSLETSDILDVNDKLNGEENLKPKFEVKRNLGDEPKQSSITLLVNKNKDWYNNFQPNEEGSNYVKFELPIKVAGRKYIPKTNENVSLADRRHAAKVLKNNSNCICYSNEELTNYLSKIAKFLSLNEKHNCYQNCDFNILKPNVQHESVGSNMQTGQKDINYDENNPDNMNVQNTFDVNNIETPNVEYQNTRPNNNFDLVESEGDEKYEIENGESELNKASKEINMTLSEGEIPEHSSKTENQNYKLMNNINELSDLEKEILKKLNSLQQENLPYNENIHFVKSTTPKNWHILKKVKQDQLLPFRKTENQRVFNQNPFVGLHKNESNKPLKLRTVISSKPYSRIVNKTDTGDTVLKNGKPGNINRKVLVLPRKFLKLNEGKEKSKKRINTTKHPSNNSRSAIIKFNKNPDKNFDTVSRVHKNTVEMGNYAVQPKYDINRTSISNIPNSVAIAKKISLTKINGNSLDPKGNLNKYNIPMALKKPNILKNFANLDTDMSTQNILFSPSNLIKSDESTIKFDNVVTNQHDNIWWLHGDFATDKPNLRNQSHKSENEPAADKTRYVESNSNKIDKLSENYSPNENIDKITEINTTFKNDFDVGDVYTTQERYNANNNEPIKGANTSLKMEENVAKNKTNSKLNKDKKLQKPKISKNNQTCNETKPERKKMFDHILSDLFKQLRNTLDGPTHSGQIEALQIRNLSAKHIILDKYNFQDSNYSLLAEKNQNDTYRTEKNVYNIQTTENTFLMSSEIPLETLKTNEEEIVKNSYNETTEIDEMHFRSKEYSEIGDKTNNTEKLDKLFEDSVTNIIINTVIRDLFAEQSKAQKHNFKIQNKTEGGDEFVKLNNSRHSENNSTLLDTSNNLENTLNFEIQDEVLVKSYEENQKENLTTILNEEHSQNNISDDLVAFLKSSNNFINYNEKTLDTVVKNKKNYFNGLEECSSCDAKNNYNTTYHNELYDLYKEDLEFSSSNSENGDEIIDSLYKNDAEKNELENRSSVNVTAIYEQMTTTENEIMNIDYEKRKLTQFEESDKNLQYSMELDNPTSEVVSNSIQNTPSMVNSSTTEDPNVRIILKIISSLDKMNQNLEMIKRKYNNKAKAATVSPNASGIINLKNKERIKILPQQKTNKTFEYKYIAPPRRESFAKHSETKSTKAPVLPSNGTHINENLRNKVLSLLKNFRKPTLTNNKSQTVGKNDTRNLSDLNQILPPIRVINGSRPTFTGETNYSFINDATTKASLDLENRATTTVYFVKQIKGNRIQVRFDEPILDENSTEYVSGSITLKTNFSSDQQEMDNTLSINHIQHNKSIDDDAKTFSDHYDSFKNESADILKFVPIGEYNVTTSGTTEQNTNFDNYSEQIKGKEDMLEVIEYQNTEATLLAQVQLPINDAASLDEIPSNIQISSETNNFDKMPKKLLSNNNYSTKEQPECKVRNLLVNNKNVNNYVSLNNYTSLEVSTSMESEFEKSIRKEEKNVSNSEEIIKNNRITEQNIQSIKDTMLNKIYNASIENNNDRDTDHINLVATSVKSSETNDHTFNRIKSEQENLQFQNHKEQLTETCINCNSSHSNSGTKEYTNNSKNGTYQNNRSKMQGIEISRESASLLEDELKTTNYDNADDNNVNIYISKDSSKLEKTIVDNLGSGFVHYMPLTTNHFTDFPTEVNEPSDASAILNKPNITNHQTLDLNYTMESKVDKSFWKSGNHLNLSFTGQNDNNVSQHEIFVLPEQSVNVILNESQNKIINLTVTQPFTDPIIKNITSTEKNDLMRKIQSRQNSRKNNEGNKPFQKTENQKIISSKINDRLLSYQKQIEEKVRQLKEISNSRRKEWKQQKLNSGDENTSINKFKTKQNTELKDLLEQKNRTHLFSNSTSESLENIYNIKIDNDKQNIEILSSRKFGDERNVSYSTTKIPYFLNSTKNNEFETTPDKNYTNNITDNCLKIKYVTIAPGIQNMFKTTSEASSDHKDSTETNLADYLNAKKNFKNEATPRTNGYRNITANDFNDVLNTAVQTENILSFSSISSQFIEDQNQYVENSNLAHLQKLGSIAPLEQSAKDNQYTTSNYHSNMDLLTHPQDLEPDKDLVSSLNDRLNYNTDRTSESSELIDNITYAGNEVETMDKNNLVDATSSRITLDLESTRILDRQLVTSKYDTNHEDKLKDILSKNVHTTTPYSIVFNDGHRINHTRDASQNELTKNVQHNGPENYFNEGNVLELDTTENLSIDGQKEIYPKTVMSASDNDTNTYEMPNLQQNALKPLNKNIEYVVDAQMSEIPANNIGSAKTVIGTARSINNGERIDSTLGKKTTVALPDYTVSYIESIDDVTTDFHMTEIPTQNSTDEILQNSDSDVIKINNYKTGTNSMVNYNREINAESTTRLFKTTAEYTVRSIEHEYQIDDTEDIIQKSSEDTVQANNFTSTQNDRLNPKMVAQSFDLFNESPTDAYPSSENKQKNDSAVSCFFLNAHPNQNNANVLSSDASYSNTVGQTIQQNMQNSPQGTLKQTYPLLTGIVDPNKIPILEDHDSSNNRDRPYTDDFSEMRSQCENGDVMGLSIPFSTLESHQQNLRTNIDPNPDMVVNDPNIQAKSSDDKSHPGLFIVQRINDEVSNRICKNDPVHCHKNICKNYLGMMENDPRFLEEIQKLLDNRGDSSINSGNIKNYPDWNDVTSPQKYRDSTSNDGSKLYENNYIDILKNTKSELDDTPCIMIGEKETNKSNKKYSVSLLGTDKYVQLLEVMRQHLLRDPNKLTKKDLLQPQVEKDFTKLDLPEYTSRSAGIVQPTVINHFHFVNPEILEEFLNIYGRKNGQSAVGPFDCEQENILGVKVNTPYQTNCLPANNGRTNNAYVKSNASPDKFFKLMMGQLFRNGN